jgi:cysteine sulfinate desulfinase/cysteine desulfurase-like protein
LRDLLGRVLEKRDRLERGILEILPLARINGPSRLRLPNTLNVTFPGFRGESLVLALDQRGVAVSSGSVCRAGIPKPSRVLLALGLSEEEAHCALRFSLGRENTAEDIERTLSILAEILWNQTAVVRFVSCR